MNIRLELISESDANDIYNFEKDNKDYFEETLPPRGEDYYKIKVFQEIIKEIVEEQNRDECYMYIIRNDLNKMIGRVNFVSIRTKEVKVAELGYRIGKNENGKGYATEAVRLALEKCLIEHKIVKVGAGTALDNIGSRRVLEKNGFVLVRKIERYIEVNGKWIDSLLFEKSLVE